MAKVAEERIQRSRMVEAVWSLTMTSTRDDDVLMNVL